MMSNYTRTELRLVGGSNGCQGRLEIKTTFFGIYGQACDNDASDNEAKVICRQLNCESEGAKIADPVK